MCAALDQLFPTAAADFSKWFGRGMSAELKDTLMALEPGQAEDALFGLFAPFALTTFSDQIKKYRCSILPPSSLSSSTPFTLYSLGFQVPG